MKYKTIRVNDNHFYNGLGAGQTVTVEAALADQLCENADGTGAIATLLDADADRPAELKPSWARTFTTVKVLPGRSVRDQDGKYRYAGETFSARSDLAVRWAKNEGSGAMVELP